MPTLKKIISAVVLGGALAASVACTQEALFTNEEKLALGRIAKFRRCVRNKQLQPAPDTQAKLAAQLRERFDRSAARDYPEGLLLGAVEVEAEDILLRAAQEGCGAEEGIGAGEIADQTYELQIRFGAEFVERQVRVLEYTHPGS